MRTVSSERTYWRLKSLTRAGGPRPVTPLPRKYRFCPNFLGSVRRETAARGIIEHLRNTADCSVQDQLCTSLLSLSVSLSRLVSHPQLLDRQMIPLAQTRQRGEPGDAAQTVVVSIGRRLISVFPSPGRRRRLVFPRSSFTLLPPTT